MPSVMERFSRFCSVQILEGLGDYRFVHTPPPSIDRHWLDDFMFSAVRLSVKLIAFSPKGNRSLGDLVDLTIRRQNGA